MFYVNTP